MSIEFFDEFKEVEENILNILANKDKANIVKDFSVIYPYESFPEGLVMMITDTSLNVLGFAKFKEGRSYFDLKSIVEDVFEFDGMTVDPLFFNVSEEVGLMVDEDKVVGFRNEDLEDFIIETVDRYDRALDSLSTMENHSKESVPKRLTEDTYGEGFNFIDEKGNLQFSKYDEDEDGEEFTSIEEVMEELGFDYEEDVVNSPNHYTYGDIETIDYIDQVTATYPGKYAFLVANVIKYISRANFKNGKQDLDKAKYYLDRLVEKYDKE